MPFSLRLISIRDPLGNVQSIGDILGNALGVVETLREIKNCVGDPLWTHIYQRFLKNFFISWHRMKKGEKLRTNIGIKETC